MSYFLTANGMNLFYTALALGLVFFGSKFLNKHNGVKFREHVLVPIHADAGAAALYYGLRWIGLCLVASALIIH